MIAIDLLTPAEIADNVRIDFRSRRKAEGDTQKEASEKTGVPLGTLKKFEQLGEISFISFIRLAIVYGDPKALGKLFLEKEPDSIDELLRKKP